MHQHVIVRVYPKESVGRVHANSTHLVEEKYVAIIRPSLTCAIENMAEPAILNDERESEIRIPHAEVIRAIHRNKPTSSR